MAHKHATGKKTSSVSVLFWSQWQQSYLRGSRPQASSAPPGWTWCRSQSDHLMRACCNCLQHVQNLRQIPVRSVLAFVLPLSCVQRCSEGDLRSQEHRKRQEPRLRASHYLFHLQHYNSAHIKYNIVMQFQLLSPLKISALLFRGFERKLVANEYKPPEMGKAPLETRK